MATAYNPFEVATRKIAEERAAWIDNTILNAIPQWKANLIRKYKSRLLAKILGVNFEVRTQQLIGEFGHRVGIFLNNKLIAERKYKDIFDKG